MNAPFRASKSAAEILRDYRITTASSAPGRHYAICPRCSHNRKQANQKLKCLGVTIDREGVKAGCNHCGWTGGDYYELSRPYAQRVGLLPPEPEAKLPAKEVFPDEAARIASASRMWSNGQSPRNTLAERYLNSRHLELPDDIADSVVRFDGASPWKNEAGEIERHPVMLTAFRSIASDKLVAVQRTLLNDKGEKLDRRMLGPVAGAAIKIDDDTDVEQGLTICEGFESGLAGCTLGFRPVWALGSAGAIGSFPVLSGIDALTILAEPDQANARAVEQCGNRWSDAGREVFVVRSAVGDMNDVVKANAA